MPDRPSAKLQQVKELSDLSWDQIAKLFGVSKRTVLSWAAGNPMNGANESVLTELANQVAELPGTPEQVRAALFADMPGGTNLFTEFIRMRYAARGPEINPGYSIVGWSDRHEQREEQTP